MKNIAFKTSPEFAHRFEDVRVPQFDGQVVIEKRLMPTRHFSQNLAKSIYPKRGLTREEIAGLSAGITVVQSKAYNLDKKEKSVGGVRFIEDPKSPSRKNATVFHGKGRKSTFQQWTKIRVSNQKKR